MQSKYKALRISRISRNSIEIVGSEIFRILQLFTCVTYSEISRNSLVNDFRRNGQPKDEIRTNKRFTQRIPHLDLGEQEAEKEGGGERFK